MGEDKQKWFYVEF